MQTTHDIVANREAVFASLHKVMPGNSFYSKPENINPTSCKGGINPCWQPANSIDRALVARSNEVNHTTAYRAQVGAMAQAVARKYSLRYGFDHLRDEFKTEAESAIGAALALRVHRFPTLASDLLARFACGALPSSAARALRRVALRACDTRLRRMTHDKMEEPAYFSLFTWSPSAEGSRAQEADTQDTCAYVNARIDLLLRLVREKGATNGNSARSATAHVNLLEQARAYLLAAARGESETLPAHGLMTDKERGNYLAKSSLYFRIYRLGTFLGDSALLGSLRHCARL